MLTVDSRGNVTVEIGGTSQSVRVENDGDSRFVNLIIENRVIGAGHSGGPLINAVTIRASRKFLRTLVRSMDLFWEGDLAKPEEAWSGAHG